MGNAAPEMTGNSTGSVKNNTGYSNGTWTVNITDAISNIPIAQHESNHYPAGRPLGITFPNTAHQRIFDGNTCGLHTCERAIGPPEVVSWFATGLPSS
jgi:alpha-galactosidase